MFESESGSHHTAPRRHRFLLWAMVAVLCLVRAAAQNGPARQPGSATLQGSLRDESSQPVADASVTLQLEAGNTGQSTRTNEKGAFAFSSLQPGNYRLTAQGTDRKTHAAATISLSSGDAKEVSLILDSSAQPVPDHAGEAMQFADKPSFTVAGVTDWTAVGGHGSDSTLRASESLVRETTTLKPENSSSGESGADRHRAAGDAAEKIGDPLTAVHDYEQAARLDPSEQNYFSWGSELLLHRAVWQAQQVLSKGAQAHPGSSRLLLALGAALFAGDVYEEAAQRVCAASDLDPAGAAAYLYLGRIDMAAPAPLDCSLTRLERFVHDRPENPLANYYTAMALLKRLPSSPSPESVQPAKNLLLKAATADPAFGDAYLQLGILALMQHDSTAAIELYSRAIKADPQLGEAHYRLAVAYDRSGKPDEARREFAAHDRIEKEQAEEVERQRREIKQFLIVLNGTPASPASP